MTEHVAPNMHVAHAQRGMASECNAAVSVMNIIAKNADIRNGLFSAGKRRFAHTCAEHDGIIACVDKIVPDKRIF